MQRNNPSTSHEAFKSVQPEMLAEHYRRILDAIKTLKIGIYEEIAQVAGFTDKNQVSRRLKELEGMELVYKPGTKKPTSTGRQAYQYSLRSETTVVTPPERYLPTDTSAADIACKIIAGTKQGKLVQKDLWETS